MVVPRFAWKPPAASHAGVVAYPQVLLHGAVEPYPKVALAAVEVAYLKAVVAVVVEVCPRLKCRYYLGHPLSLEVLADAGVVAYHRRRTSPSRCPTAAQATRIPRGQYRTAKSLR
jgi:hypothetical protein